MCLYAESDDGAWHPEGEHRYPFELLLPSDLPASFKGEYGYVKYEATAIIEKSAWKSDYRTNMIFSVLGNLDLNREPSALRVRSQ